MHYTTSNPYMIHSQTEQYMWADRILRAVCLAGGVTFVDIVSESRSGKTDKLRGVYCLITRNYGVHPDRAARLIARSRQNVINQAKRYLHYLQSRDGEITLLYMRVKKILKQYDYEK